MGQTFTFRAIRAKAKKPENLWFRVFYSCSTGMVWLAIRLRATPNQLTVVGFVLNAVACLYFMLIPLSATAIVVALLAFFVAHLFDCADGHLAFVTDQRTESGRWLDSALDVFKSALIALCFCKLAAAGGLPTKAVASNPLKNAALISSLGALVNYAVAIHASQHAQKVDSYKALPLHGGRLLPQLGWPMGTILSHICEYGNLLLTFALFAVSVKMAFAMLIGLGLSHYVLALYRIFRIARVLNARAQTPAESQSPIPGEMSPVPGAPVP